MSESVKLYHVEAGQGTPLVLLHGFPLSHEVWQAQIESLGQHYRVIAPDLRGHGKSPVPTGVYDMETMAADVFALLDSLGIARAVILGHSMGGYIALAGWRQSPQRFAGLGLIASQAAADTDEARQNRFRLADLVQAEGSGVVAQTMLPRLFASKPDPTLDQVRTLIRDTSPTGIVGALHGMAARADSTALVPQIDVPVLVVAGAKDAIVPLEKAQALAATLQNGTFVAIDGAGHMPMLERPEAVTQAIADFVRTQIR